MSKIGNWILNTFFKDHMYMFNYYQKRYDEMSSTYNKVCADRDKYSNDLEQKNKT